MKKTTLLINWLFLVLCFTCTSIFAQLKIENLTHYKEFDGFKVDDIISDRTGTIWMASKNWLITFDGYEQIRYHPDPTDSTTIGTLNTSSVFEDRNGYIWIGSDYRIYRFNPITESFKSYTVVDFNYLGVAYPAIRHIKSDHQGRIYFGFFTSTIKNFHPDAIAYYEEETDEIRIFDYGDQSKAKKIHYADSDVHGNIWLRTDSGLAKINTNQHYEIISDSYKVDGHFINSIKTDGEGLVWFTTADFRLHQYDPKTKTVTTIPIKPFENQKPIRAKFALEVDKDQNIWIGTTEGLVYYNRRSRKFETFEPTKNQNTFTAPIRELHVDRFNNLWIATTNDEIYKYAKRTILNAFVSEIKDPTSLTSGWAQKMFELEDGRVVVVTDGGTKPGFNIINLKTKELESILYSNIFPNTIFRRVLGEKLPGVIYIKAGDLFYHYHLASHRVEKVEHPDIPHGAYFHSIFLDSKGNTWYCTSNGLYLEKEGKDELKHFDIEKSHMASSTSGAVVGVHESGNNGLWLITNDGLFLLDYETYTITRHGYTNAKEGSFHLQDLQTLYDDQNGTLWVGTWEGGLSKYDVAIREVKTYGFKEGLPSMSIQGILPDDEDGVLWLSTFGGISRFDTKTETFTNYYKEDGIHGLLFTDLSYLKTSNGWFLFGGENGITYFHPKDLVETSRAPNVFITSVKSDTTSYFLGEKDKTPIQNAENLPLFLTYQENSIAISYTGIQYDDPLKNTFSYRLENYDDKWKNVGNARTAYYQNLPPGNYTFQVKGANSNGVQSEQVASIKLYIAPPWWRTNLAYLLFFLTFAGILYWIYQFQLNRRLQLEETNRLKELDQFKSKLYTNITHEFRTPLTVILGMADQVNKQPKKAIELIKRNGQNLLTLVNQMLDLSKLESGNLKLELAQKDIVSFLLYVAESFQSLGESKGIRLVAYSEIDELVMDYDEEKLKQVISNLLTNAIKFTNENGKVILHIKQSNQNLQIKVQDNGMGIPPDQLPKIFDRFYQVDDSSIRKGEGTGIGLALTKELVKLMNGEINVTSQLKKGTEFKILLPIQNIAPKAVPNLTPIINSPSKKEKTTSTFTSNAEANGSSEKPILLLIEDNEDVITYIETCLEEEYEIKKAFNGQLGIDKAFELTPDLIISDVMMPEKDGYEVCATLKTDTRTSHIPIILLTAKTTEEDKIAGLKQGADAYLTKPFNKEELSVRLEKLLALRKQLQKRYSSFSVSFSPSKSTNAETDLNAIFLQKIRKEIEDKMSDSDLGIPQLCRAVRLSHSQVYRKIKALTGEHPTGYIRKMRLYKAKEMLQTTTLNVSEVAYEVGFTDPNHFSRVFSQEFKSPPSAMRK